MNGRRLREYKIECCAIDRFVFKFNSSSRNSGLYVSLFFKSEVGITWWWAELIKVIGQRRNKEIFSWLRLGLVAEDDLPWSHDMSLTDWHVSAARQSRCSYQCSMTHRDSRVGNVFFAVTLCSSTTTTTTSKCCQARVPDRYFQFGVDNYDSSKIFEQAHPDENFFLYILLFKA